MGLSFSVAAAILLVGGLYFGSVLAQSYVTAQDEVRRGLDTSEQRAMLKRLGAIRIDSESYNGGQDRVTITATNTGGITFVTSQVDVLLDGVVRNDAVTSRLVEGVNTDVWSPGTELVIVLEPITSNPQRTILVTDTGATDTEVN